MGIFSRINKGLKKTRENMSGAIDSMLHGKTEIDDDFYDELEEILVMGDVGCMTASEIVEKLRERVAKKHLRKPEAVKNEIKEIVAEMLEGGEEMSLITLPSVILVIGVNGVDRDFGLSTASELEAATKIAAMAQARESYCLSEHSKFGKTALYKLCPLAAVQGIVTDSGLDPELRQEYGALTRLLIAQ